jgi:hypothetical protein
MNPIICPFCGAAVKREPFFDIIEEDDSQWFYVGMDGEASSLVGDIRRWCCIIDNSHVFFCSTKGQ